MHCGKDPPVLVITIEFPEVNSTYNSPNLNGIRVDITSPIGRCTVNACQTRAERG